MARPLFSQIRQWWITYQPRVYGKSRAIFHFKKTGGWVIGLCWGIGVTVALGTAFQPVPRELFYLAYALFLFGFVWSLGSFLTSDPLRDRNPKFWSRQRKKKPEDVRRGNKKFHLISVSVSIALFGLFCFSWWVTYLIQDRRELSEMFGVLIPANDPDPPSTCDDAIPDDALRVYWGNSVTWFRGNHMGMISFGDKEVVGAQREANGNVVINADITSDGKSVLFISRNNFDINDNNIIRSMSGRPDHSTIVLADQYRNRFEIRYLNKHSMQLSGKFVLSRSATVEIEENGPTRLAGGIVRGGCFANAKNAINVK